MRAHDVEMEDLEYIHENLESELEEISGKNLLITGGAGFLGFYLTKTIVRWNEQTDANDQINLYIVDRCVRGVPRWLEAILDANHPGISMSFEDVGKQVPFENVDFDYVMHAASIASPSYYRQWPIETMDANVNGVRVLLDRVRAQPANHPCEGFLFFSSSEVYGDPDTENIPTAESYRGFVSCTGPRACYDESKRYGETLCMNFFRQHHLPVKIARPFNNYGPGCDINDKRVIPDFARDIFNGDSITVYSDGTPTRTFSYVADDIIGYYKILLRGKSGEIYNIGADDLEVSISWLADRVRLLAKTHFGYFGHVVYKTHDDTEYLTDNPNRRFPDLNKIRKELGFSPKIDLDKGLLRTLYWYRENVDGA
jgi:dTDP-glucose 4,6-dehydratase/UDP-glucuronate decarboxylase